MAIERQSPDAILAILSLTPNNVAYIQDDPDTPDANWLVANNNNSDTEVRVSFPTPTGNPTVGADLQEFKIRVRQFSETQSGTPLARIELWENGVLVRAGTNTNVPVGGLLLSFTWNASEISTANGSLVECRVYGTKSGGSPTARNAVDVGAVEWNVTYSAGVVVTPPIASLSIGTFAPTIAVTNNVTVVPPIVGLTSTLFAPAILTNTILIPNIVSLSLATFVPTIDIQAGGTTVIPAIASLSLVAYAPSAEIDVVIVPSIASLTITSYIASVNITDNITVMPSVIALSSSVFIPTILVSTVLTPNILALTLAGFAPNISATQNIWLTPNTLALILSTYIPSISTGGVNVNVSPDLLELILSSFAPSWWLDRILQIHSNVTISEDLNITPTIASLRNINSSCGRGLKLAGVITRK